MIEILLEHPWFLVINKPSGLLTQAVLGIPCIQTLLVEQLRTTSQSDATPFVGIPHRLDRGTSGALLIARNQRALKRFSEQFASRKTDKVYHAIVAGHVEPQSEAWVDFLRKIPDVAKAEIVSPDHPDARLASLQVKPLASLLNADQSPATLVEIVLETGRMHQIRLQFASRGYPILGDSLYGSTVRWLDASPGERESPIALHAQSISFLHPQNGERVSVVAPYPAGWDSALGNAN